MSCPESSLKARAVLEIAKFAFGSSTSNPLSTHCHPHPGALCTSQPPTSQTVYPPTPPPCKVTLLQSHLIHIFHGCLSNATFLHRLLISGIIRFPFTFSLSFTLILQPGYLTHTDVNMIPNRTHSALKLSDIWSAFNEASELWSWLSGP